MRQEVTGLIVNKKVNVDRRYIRNIRAMLHNWRTKGIEICQKDMIRKYKKAYLYINRTNNSMPNFKMVLKGMIDFIGLVRGREDGLYKKFLKEYSILNNEFHTDKNDSLNNLLEYL